MKLLLAFILSSIVQVLPGSVSHDRALVFVEDTARVRSVTGAADAEYTVKVGNRTFTSKGTNTIEITGLKPGRGYSIKVRSGDRTVGSAKFRTSPDGGTVNVLDFGAAGDGHTLCTEAIQKAIDACPDYGEVIIPAGEYVTGALFIERDNITVRLCEGAVLRASHSLDDFPPVKNIYEGWVKEVYSSVINIGSLYGKPVRNIRICGGGTIDGQGSVLADMQTEARDRMARSHGMPVIRAKDVSLENITIQNPCTWNVHPLLTEGFTTWKCLLKSSGYGLSNADGWDPDSSKDCYLLDSVLDGQDDNIAVKSVAFPSADGSGTELKPSEHIRVDNCRIVRGGGLVVGAELPGGARDVVFSNCAVENCDRGIHVCSRPYGTVPVEDIHFRNIDIKHAGCWGINVTLWYWVQNFLSHSTSPDNILQIKNISFEDIRIAHADGNPIQILGADTQPVRNVLFDNVSIEESRYDVLLRNCRDITFRNSRTGGNFWIEDNAAGVTVDGNPSVPKMPDLPYAAVDPDATYTTKALLWNLHRVAESGKFLLGMQDATASGYGWNDDSGVSDIERVSGKRPEVYCWDFMDVVTFDGSEHPNASKVRRLALEAYYRGGIASFCWHAVNPADGSGFYTLREGTVGDILPGGRHNAKFREMLAQIAKFNETLVGMNGDRMPVIFRPWHECDGDWFWWGRKCATKEEVKELYRYTVTCLRDELGVHNFLYAFSPDINFTTEEEYLEWYPGDEYVDIIGLDNYWLYRPECTDIGPARTRLKVISGLAEKHGKVAALTETGQGGIETRDWFSGRLLESVYGNPEDGIRLAYVAFWRNSKPGYFTPYEGHPAMEDFLKFLSDPRVVLMDPCDWLGKMYHIVPSEKEHFVGANFWYGAILGSPDGTPGSDRERLRRELDEMKSLGITNLRVLVGADGPDGVAVKVQPALQPAPGKYNGDILEGLDYLLEQMELRGMKAVLYINNSWEWSGGYGTYLEWAGKGRTPDTRTEGYDRYTAFVSQFMTCPEAQEMFFDHVRFIVGRYRGSNAIYSWQIGNEPRCFSPEAAVQDEFVKYIDRTSRLIKSIDGVHPVSIGSEGVCGCEGSLELYERINACPAVDYITIHIWPYNWGWARESSLSADVRNAIRNSDIYIDQALEVAERLGKDVVIEEFGFPRDGFAFMKGSPVTARDAYYTHIFSRILRSRKTGGRLVGANFWGWGGFAEQAPGHVYWETGDDYCGDPSQEQQGLNSVYADDESTLEIIRHFNDELKKQY